MVYVITGTNSYSSWNLFLKLYNKKIRLDNNFSIIASCCVSGMRKSANEYWNDDNSKQSGILIPPYILFLSELISFFNHQSNIVIKIIIKSRWNWNRNCRNEAGLDEPIDTKYN